MKPTSSFFCDTVHILVNVDHLRGSTAPGSNRCDVGTTSGGGPPEIADDRDG